MDTTASVYLATDEDTRALGETLARKLGPGCVVLLDGPIGAGKTSLARAVIQSRMSRLGQVEDVPSPTYTLVQTYDDGESEIWHADLYRLSEAGEVAELGLDAAFEDAVVLVEWPDRLGADVPQDALSVTMSVEGDGRRASFAWSDPRWTWVGHLGTVDA